MALLLVGIASLEAAPAARAEADYSGPLFDAHAHIRIAQPGGNRLQQSGGPAKNPASSLTNPVSALREAGLSALFLFGPYPLTAQEQKSNPDFVYPFASVPFDPQTRQLHMHDAAVSMIEQQLSTGSRRGIGEIPLRHRPTFTNDYQGYPADGPMALRLYDLAA